MNKSKSKYSFCDFCHKGFPADDLERFTITGKKCKSCFPNMSGENVREVVSKTTTEVLNKPKKTMPAVIPPQLKEAFMPPEELQPKVIVPGAKTEKTK